MRSFQARPAGFGEVGDVDHPAHSYVDFGEVLPGDHGWRTYPRRSAGLADVTIAQTIGRRRLVRYGIDAALTSINTEFTLAPCI